VRGATAISSGIAFSPMFMYNGVEEKGVFVSLLAGFAAVWLSHPVP
jgi:hypothetical protein